MSNANVRIQRLVKSDLKDYSTFFLGFLGLVMGAILLNWIFRLFFGMGGFQMNVGNINIDIHTGDVLLEGFFNMVSFSVVGFMMFVSGCVAGYELPQNVRRGVARGEYFISVVIAAVIVSLLAAPFVFVVSTISNFLVPSGSIFYGAFHVSGSGMVELAVQFLMYVAVFFMGFFIAMVWQRLGWLLGLIVTVGFLVVLGFLGFVSSAIVTPFVFLDVFNVTRIGEYWFEFQWDVAANGMFALLAIGMMVVFGIGARLLIKNVAVKVR